MAGAVGDQNPDREAPDLLVALKRPELTLGRDPRGWRFGPRLIDLDILAIDGRCVADAEIDLLVPHPRLVERRFALEPLAELDPDLQPWGGCDDVRADVTGADLLPAGADQQGGGIAGAEWG